VDSAEDRINISKFLIIPDGHRRFAEQNDINCESGYLRGAERAVNLITKCSQNTTVSHLAFYFLTAKNFEERDCANLDSVFSAMDAFANKLDSFAENLTIIYRGSLKRLPHATQRRYERLLHKSSALRHERHEKMTLELLIDYDGAQELFTLTTEQMQYQMDHPYEIVIRTGGAFRLSGAPPLECHGADMFSLPIMFPQLSYDDILSIIIAYRTEKRRRKNLLIQAIGE